MLAEAWLRKRMRVDAAKKIQRPRAAVLGARAAALGHYIPAGISVLAPSQAALQQYEVLGNASTCRLLGQAWQAIALSLPRAHRYVMLRTRSRNRMRGGDALHAALPSQTRSTGLNGQPRDALTSPFSRHFLVLRSFLRLHVSCTPGPDSP
jgi:hypothetical protein